MLKLTTYFKRINKTCFKNRLPPCPITIGKMPPATAAMFSYDETYDDRFVNPRISIGKVKYIESDIVKILIHEMTHYEEYLARYRYGTRKRRVIDRHTKKFFLKTAKREIDYSFRYKTKLNKLSTEF